MEHASVIEEKTRGIWRAIADVLAELARTSGCSLHHSPLPEIREAAREWRDWPRAS
jgi:hypothetical protein